MIRVGGATEVEVKERKDRVDDAMHATRAAVEEGVVPGGGVALLYGIKVLAKLQPENEDQKVGIDIVRRALAGAGAADRRQRRRGRRGHHRQAPREKGDPIAASTRRAGEYKDMIAAGIIDPTKVVRLALQGAASVAALLITTEAMVAEKVQKKVSANGERRGHGGHELLTPALRRPDRSRRRRKDLPRMNAAVICKLFVSSIF